VIAGPSSETGERAAKPAGAAPLLMVDGLKAYYQFHAFGLTRDVRAVDDVTFQIGRNEIYGLAGESSSGKSTLIKTIARAIKPPLTVVGGSVLFDFKDGQRDMYRLSPAELDAVRWSRLSYIMQGSMSVLNPVRRIRHSFEDFARRHVAGDTIAFRGVVERHLARLHLEPRVLDAYPHELSGGMRQRVTIALATVCGPEFIIADEPTTALDVIVQKGVLAMLREIQHELGSSVLFVTHDMAVHANLTDRLGIMYAGRLVEEGPTRTVFTQPRHPYTAHLISSLPRLGDEVSRTGLPGAPPSLAAPPPGCRFHPRCRLAIEICRSVVPPMEELGPGHRVACHVASAKAEREAA
jgi:peptide/nickel transport system ATP-binding protein